VVTIRREGEDGEEGNKGEEGEEGPSHFIRARGRLERDRSA